MADRDVHPPPPPPYPGYLDRLMHRLQQDAAHAEAVRSPHDGAPADVVAALEAAVGDLGGDLVAFSHDLHAHPEVGYAEHHAVSAVARLLADHGIDCEIGAYGLDTALRAGIGDGAGPRVAVLAEYDALPEIGHACGHNVIAATAVGAFLALARVQRDLGGSVELIGTPAEEGGGGKELIARAGGFAGVDAAIMLHPMNVEVAEHPWLGVRQVQVTYTGRPAHASVMPFLGRNALDAVVSAYNGIAQLRQHILPGDRVHGIITDGGRKPNIVPARAQALFYLRSGQPETLAELSERAEAIFRAAAVSTGTGLELEWDPCPVYLPVRNNAPLAARYAEAMRRRGRRVLPRGVVPEHMTGSTDMGNVSVRVPAIHPTLKIAPYGVTIHEPEFATWAVGEEADRGCVDGAFGLAVTAADFLADARLRDDVRKLFDAQGGALEPDGLLR